MSSIYRYARLAEEGNRFAEAQLLDSLEPAEPAVFPQRPGALNALLGQANSEPAQAEDAFHVRIQAPQDAERAPVIVFLPGGGFLSGGGDVRWFDSPAWLPSSGAVLVTVTYRVGVLGHLGPTGDPSESQRGLRDVLCALDWVRQHISQWGGDPQNITLAGDSAGAWYAYAAATLPRAAAGIRRLALISLPREHPLSEAEYAERRDWFCAELGGEHLLRTAETEQLLEVQARMARRWAGRGMPLMPAAGADVAPDLHSFGISAARLDVEQLLLLTTSEEAAAFLYSAPEEAFGPESVEGFLAHRFADPDAARHLVAAKRPAATPKQQMIEAMTLHQFRTAQLELAAAASKRMPVYVLGFAAQSRFPGAFSPHCYPLPFLFGRRQRWWDAPMLQNLPEAEFGQLAAHMQRCVIGFAADRTLAGLEPYDPSAPLRWEIGPEAVHASAPAEAGLLTR